MTPRQTTRRTGSGERIGRAPKVRRPLRTAGPDARNQSDSAGSDRHQRLNSWGTALTGAAAVAALLFTGISSYQTQNELKSRTRELDIAQQGQETDRQGQTADRFTTAVSQLDDDKSVDVRLGGIYALQRIMTDSPDDQPTVVNVLSAYVRTHSEASKHGGSQDEEASAEEDVLAAARALGASEPDWRAQVDLHDTYLRGAVLRDAVLGGAVLRGADLRDADLLDAVLRGAGLRNVDLRDADLRRADLGGADLSGADLRGAKLSDADLAFVDLRDADLRGADLSGADLSGVDREGARGLPSGDSRY